jgi:hypothetical protein
MSHLRNKEYVGLFTVLLIVVVILAVIGIGWKTFTIGVINGFERVIDLGAPFVKDLTQEAEEIVDDPTLTSNPREVFLFNRF